MRGRVWKVDVERFRKAINQHVPYWLRNSDGRYDRTPQAVRAARLFGVNERTVRRWMLKGMPLCYGRDTSPSFITREQFEEFERTGKFARKVSVSGSQGGQVDSGRPVRAPSIAADSSTIGSRRRTSVDRNMSVTPARRTANRSRAKK